MQWAGECVSQHAIGQGSVYPRMSAQWGVNHPQADTPSPPPETATEAGGTHPTGMHSCY